MFQRLLTSDKRSLSCLTAKASDFFSQAAQVSQAATAQQVSELQAQVSTLQLEVAAAKQQLVAAKSELFNRKAAVDKQVEIPLCHASAISDSILLQTSALALLPNHSV